MAFVLSSLACKMKPEKRVESMPVIETKMSKHKSYEFHYQNYGSS
jgi:hypothetical protein